MNEQATMKHSVNCYFCGALADERECLPADDFNDGDGGTICGYCEQNFKFKILHDTICDGWIAFGNTLYPTKDDAKAEVQEVMDDLEGYTWDQFRFVAVKTEEVEANKCS